MGAGMHGGFGNTGGARASSKVMAESTGIKKTYTLTQRPNPPKYHYYIPSDPSKQKHIFGNRAGHMPDTLENRELIRNVANHKSYYKGKDSHNNHWYARKLADGSQVWVKTHAGKISNAGRNIKPRRWNHETGYDNNPKHNNTWRKKK